MQSKPFSSFEKEKEHRGDKYAQPDDEGIGAIPLEFGHFDVHTVPADDQCQGHEDGGNDGEDAHQVVLFDIDLRLIRFAHLGHIIPQVEDMGKQAVDSAVEYPEIAQVFRRYDPVLVFHETLEYIIQLLIIPLQLQKLAP